MATRWMNFLNSLSTRGGAIVILLMLTGVWVGVTLHIIHHGEDSSMIAAALVSTLGNFTGALLLALKGSSETVIAPPSVPQAEQPKPVEAPKA